MKQNWINSRIKLLH
jgi:hypothetical protein